MTLTEIIKSVPIMDWEHLRSVSDGDPDFEQELLQDFAEFYSHTLSELNCRTDLAELAKIAHTLKGSARTIGAQRIGAIAEFLEKSFKSNQMVEGINDVLGRAIDEFILEVRQTELRDAA